MADSWQSAWVEVLPDLSGFRDKTNSALIPVLSSAGDKGGAGFRTSFFGQVFAGSFLANLATGIVSTLADAIGNGIRAGIQYGADSITLASDLAETRAAVQQIFGAATPGVEAFASKANQSLGQTKNQALAASKTFGALGNAAGLKGDALTEFSTNLVSLATDLASFNNTDVDTALNALRAGLSGESEPLRQYQVFLNDATLKQKALELGIYDGSGALTDQQRILAANGAIFDRTAIQQGDFARTSDGLANQQKILNASFEEAQTSLGEFLLPGFTTIVQYANDNLIPKLGEVIEEIGPGLGEALETVGPQLGNLADTVAPLVADFAKWVGTDGIPAVIDLMEELADAAPEWAAALDTLGNPNSDFNKWFAEFRDGPANFRRDVLVPWFESADANLISSQEQIKNTGRSLTINFAEGVASGGPDAQQASQGVADAAQGPLDGMTADSYLAGVDGANGLAEGLASGRVRVGLVAKGLADEAVHQIKHGLKINSPSKVMAELGAYAAEGFGLGWNTGLDVPSVSIPGISPNVSSAPALSSFDAGSMRLLRDALSRVVELNVDGQTIARGSMSGSAQLTALGAN